jgi:predicted nucleic acid-binding protein
VKTAVDTNVLLDVLAGDEAAAAAAGRALAEAARTGALAISPIVYAELAVAFEEPAILAAFLADTQIEVEALSPHALLLAAAAWRAYAKQRGQGVQCPHCGEQFEPHCPRCGATVRWRQHIISDFLIGGHAHAQADTLLTRDRGCFSRYFPSLRVRAPGGK